MDSNQNHALMQSHLAKWQASNLSQAEYCRRHGLKPHVFSYYKVKFNGITAPTFPSNPLVQVKLLADGDSATASQPTRCEVYRLSHANGFSLEINTDADLAALKPLLKMLGSLA